MSTSSHTDIDEIINDLALFADFEEVESVVKAKKFITAATRYLLVAPQSQSDQGSSMTISVSQIEALLKRARAYVAHHNSTAIAGSSSSGTRLLGIGEGFRG